MKKLVIAVPMYEHVPAEFLSSFLALDKPEGTEVGFTRGTLVYNARNQLFKEAVARGADLIFWLDSDILCPPDTLSRFAHRLKVTKDVGEDPDKCILSGLYFKRGLPTEPVIAKSIEWWQSDTDVHQKVELFHGYGKYRSWFEVAGCGFGCCLMPTKAVLDVANHFNMPPFDPLPGLGEDLSFCFKAQQLGYKIWCDPKTKCGHVGVHVYTEADYLLQQEQKVETYDGI